MKNDPAAVSRIVSIVGEFGVHYYAVVFRVVKKTEKGCCIARPFSHFAAKNR